MTQTFVFIYAKEGKIKALSIEDSKEVHEQLITENWVHTATLYGCRFIEYLHNDCIGVWKEVKSLSNIKKGSK